MNVRQFLNSTICAGAERSTKLRSTLYIIPKFLFPEFMKGQIRIHNINNPWKFGFFIYILVFILVFLVQAGLAYQNGVFFVVLENNTKEFLEDYANLINYLILVEAYCISGSFFLYYSNNIDKLLEDTDITNYLELESPSSSTIGGYVTILFVIFAALIGSVGYALEVQNYSNYWYMDKGGSKTISEFAGYYYLYLNCLLLLFVSFVGVAHFSLFRTASSISKGLRSIYHSNDLELMRHWSDENNVKKWFAPFSSQILISKIFVLSCILNLMSWKMGEPAIGKMHDISVLIMVVIGMWIVTLPRYYIQYNIFRIRQKIGVLEYKDVRMPWVIGGSAFVDMILIVIIGKVLLNSKTLVGFAEKILGG